MPYSEERHQTRDGLELFERHWLPDSEPAAVVVFVHGFIEHGGRYAELAGELTARGYAVYATDHRGHGKSEGEPIFVSSFDLYVDDVETALDRARARHPDKRLFLIGHSMGGAIVLLAAMRRAADLSGVVTSAGAICVGRGVFPLLRKLAGVVSRVFPKLRLLKMGGAMLSRDPQVVEEFRNDPLVFHGRFPVRTGSEILRAAAQIQDQAHTIDVPLLILHGSKDVVTDPGGARLLNQRAVSTDKTLKLYDGLYHDLFHEPEKAQVISDVIAWLDARTPHTPL